MIPGGSRRERHQIRGQIGKEEVQIPPACTLGSWVQRSMCPARCAPRAACTLQAVPAVPDGEGGEAGALPGELVTTFVSFQGLWSSPATCYGDGPSPMEWWHVAVGMSLCNAVLGTEPVLCSAAAEAFLWEQRLILNESALLFYIYWRISHLIILSLTRYCSALLYDLPISNEHALWSTNLHGNPYKSGGKCSLCLQFDFLFQKLPSNINLYNSSKKKI